MASDGHVQRDTLLTATGWIHASSPPPTLPLFPSLLFFFSNYAASFFLSFHLHTWSTSIFILLLAQLPSVNSIPCPPPLPFPSTLTTASPHPSPFPFLFLPQLSACLSVPLRTSPTPPSSRPPSSPLLYPLTLFFSSSYPFLYLGGPLFSPRSCCPSHPPPLHFTSLHLSVLAVPFWLPPSRLGRAQRQEQERTLIVQVSVLVYFILFFYSLGSSIILSELVASTARRTTAQPAQPAQPSQPTQLNTAQLDNTVCFGSVSSAQSTTRPDQTVFQISSYFDALSGYCPLLSSGLDKRPPPKLSFCVVRLPLFPLHPL